MTPVGRLVILRSIPKDKLVAALATLTIPSLMGPVIGPPLGGLIVTIADWQWIFFVNIPFVIVALIGGRRVMRDSNDPRITKLPDLLGAVFVARGQRWLAEVERVTQILPRGPAGQAQPGMRHPVEQPQQGHPFQGPAEGDPFLLKLDGEN